MMASVARASQLAGLALYGLHFGCVCARAREAE